MAVSNPNMASTSVAHLHEHGQCEESCIMCGQAFLDINEKVTLTQKGCDRINEVSEQFEDNITAYEGNYVHRTCRASYTNHHYVSAKLKRIQNPDVLPRKRPCDRLETDNRTACLFCGKGEKIQKKWNGQQKQGGQLIPVRRSQFQETVLQSCDSRSDPWGRQVKARIEYLQDCVAQEVVYHRSCYSNFRTCRSVPKLFSDGLSLEKTQTCLGRPLDKTRYEAFESVVWYLQEANSDKITVPDLVRVMSGILEGTGSEAYTTSTMKAKLIERFAYEITFVQAQGRADVVSLKKPSSTILRDFYHHEKCNDHEQEKLRVIRAASDLIRCDIQAMESSGNDSENHAESIPLTLRTLLRHIVQREDTDLNVSTIGQAIVELLRPKPPLAPLQAGLAQDVQVEVPHRHTQSS